MHAKNLKTKLIGGISILIMLIVTMIIPSPSYAGTGSAFLGDWYGTDVDGSDIHLVIAGMPAGPFHITSTDSYLSFCNGGAGIIQGTAAVSPGYNLVIDANLKVVCFSSGNSLEFGTSFVYNSNIDTLSGMSVTWYRAAGHAPACIIPALGLTGWWPGDGNGEDIVGRRTGTFMGDATTGPGLVDKAFLLDGNDDYIEVSDDPALNIGTEDFTIDLWVNFDDLKGEQVLVEKWIQADEQEHTYSQGWTLTKLENQALLLAMDDGLAGEWGVGSLILDIRPNTWYLFAATRQDRVVTLYMNGVVIANDEINPYNLDAPTSLKFGRREGYQGFYLNGSIDEVEIYNGTALTEGQIFELYTAGRLGKCKEYINGPGIRAHPASEMVDAWWWPEDRRLTLTVDDPSTPKNPDVMMKKSGADKFAGTVWFDLTSYDLKPGDIVSLTDGVLTKELVVSTLTINYVDADLDIEEGSADPGTNIRLPYPSEMFVTADNSGYWSVNFGLLGIDLQPGTTMLAEDFDLDGDLTIYEYWIPIEP